MVARGAVENTASPAAIQTSRALLVAIAYTIGYGLRRVACKSVQ